MNRLLKTNLIFALIFIFSTLSQAQTKTNNIIGIVDVNLIAQQLPESQEAEKKLKDMQKVVADSLAKMQESFQKRVEAYYKQKGMMQLTEQQKQEDAFRQEEQQLVNYRDMKIQELQLKRDEFLEPLRKKITVAIAEVAKEEKLKIVLDKSSQIPVVLYAEDNLDITFKVLDKIKRGAK
jgi:Skp family chaperone for outer membrane proteins